MQQHNAPPSPEPANYRHVLVVDDNPAVVAAITTRLVPLGWACMTALDGHDAMELMTRHPVDAIITDIDMPYVDGFGIIELAVSFQKCPVLAITGSGESLDRCQRDYPTVPVLSKPFTSEQVLAFLAGLALDAPDDATPPAKHAA
ncbi:MAG: response regulator [Phycisphaerales bacterium JB063]